MARLVEFPLRDGGTVLIEVPDAPAGGQVTRGLRAEGMAGRVAEDAKRTFEEAIDRIQPATETLMRRLRSQDTMPDEVQLEFGLDFHAEAGAFIAAASTGANFKVTLTWRRTTGAPASAESG